MATINKDKTIFDLIKKEELRQKTSLQLIPSENIASKEVRAAVGSVLCNKYSEGYPNKRYYQGNSYCDAIETVAIDRAKKLFGVETANVQAYSGSPANMAVYYALLDPGECVLGMQLSAGGHLTHGHPKVNFSGVLYASIQYSLDKNGLIDYAQIEKLVKTYQPKIIVSGSTAYPREIDFKKIGDIAKKYGIYHLADISHIAGLVAADCHMSPVKYADIVTTTTHKTLRGPRGAIIMVTKRGLKKDPDLADKIDKAIFPGLQGGPHDNTIAGIAVCLKEADSLRFKKYIKQVVKNCKTLAKELIKYGFNLSTKGTDNHLILIDLGNKNINGWCAAGILELAGIVVNKNTVPNETKSAFITSGIRLGTPFVTSMGLKENDMKKIAFWIDKTINIAQNHIPSDIESGDKQVSKKARILFKEKIGKDEELKAIREEIKAFCLKRWKKLA